MAIVAVVERPNYSASTARDTRVTGRFKCDAGDCRSDKIDPCVLPRDTSPKTDLRVAGTRAGAAKWQLIVLGARAIGERGQTRWRHGRHTLPSRSCLVSLELSGGWQKTIDCSHQSGGCR